MFADAESIDDLHVDATTAWRKVFGEVRVPSTYGTFLRFTFGHVRQFGIVELEDSDPGDGVH